MNRFGTSIVITTSWESNTLTVVRHTAHASKFKLTGRISAHVASDCPSCNIFDLAALANGRFLLVYRTGRRLLARTIDRGGRLLGSPHVLATHFSPNVQEALPTVAVDSDASRAVVVWGVNNDEATAVRIEGAIHDQSGWSSAKLFYSLSSSAPAGPFFLSLVSDSHDRFLVSVHGANGDSTAVMWGLPGGSQQWEAVTPPQAADASNPDSYAAYYGAKVASVNGTIAAAWQDASGALLVSSWDGSAWSAPVTAVAGSKDANGYPILIDPVFVSDGSRAALVWSDFSQGLLGPLEATIRDSPSAGWSAPVVFPHSRGGRWPPHVNTTDTFWFTTSGVLAGVWDGDPISGDVDGLYAGTAGDPVTLSRTAQGAWFVLPRAGGLHTIVWSDQNGQPFFDIATGDGVIQRKQQLPGCGAGAGASNPEASAQLLLGGARLHHGTCRPALLW